MLNNQQNMVIIVLHVYLLIVMSSRVGGVPPQDMMMGIHEVITQNIPSKQVSY